MDSSGNISTPGTFKTGVGSGNAGVLTLLQGTAPGSLTVNGINFYAPTSVTTQGRVFAGVPATGVSLWTNSSGTMTETLLGTNGTGTTLCLTISCSMTTPSLGAATATTINKVTITAPATGSTLTIPDGVTFTGPTASGTAATLGNTETITGTKTFSGPNAYGTPASINLTNATSVPITLTTSGSSGAATYTQSTSTLNIPQYSGGGGGGVNAQTTNYTLVSGDTGKLVTMNGISLTASLPSSPPSATWYVAIENLAATALTVSRNGLTINGAASNITLQQFQWTVCYTDNSNYFCKPPVAAGANITLTMSAIAETIVGAAATGCTPSGSTGALQANNGAGGCAAAAISDASSVLTFTEPMAAGSTSAALPIGFQAVAGTGGVTANMAAIKDTSVPTKYVLPSTPGSCGSGIAASSVSASATFLLYTVPELIVTAVADNAITAGHKIVGYVTTPGAFSDSGFTVSGSINSNVAICGTAITSQATPGNTFLMKWAGTGQTGTVVPLAALATQANATEVMNGSGGTAAPAAVAIPTSASGLKTDANGHKQAQTANDLGGIVTCTDSGSGTAYSLTCSPANTAQSKGMRVCWLPANANSGTTPTLQVDGLLSAHTIVKAGGAVAANDIITTAIACAIYDTTGTQWELQNPQTTSGGSVSAGTSIAVSGSTVSYNPFDTTQVILFDEPFCNSGNGNGAAGNISVGREGWLTNIPNSGTALAIQKSASTDNNHICGINVRSPASISNGYSLTLGNNAASAQIQSGIYTASQFKPFEIQWQAKMYNSTPDTTHMRFYLGLMNNTGIPGSNVVGCGFRYDTTLSDSGWVGFCGDATTWATTSAILSADNSIHRFRMWQTAQGTVNFSIDGGSTSTVTTKIPTSTSTAMTVTMAISNDGTSTTSEMDLFRAVGRITGLVVN
jgi:hypothetical protein